MSAKSDVLKFWTFSKAQKQLAIFFEQIFFKMIIGHREQEKLRQKIQKRELCFMTKVRTDQAEMVKISKW